MRDFIFIAIGFVGCFVGDKIYHRYLQKKRIITNKVELAALINEVIAEMGGVDNGQDD